jgi:hypothetical protein
LIGRINIKIIIYKYIACYGVVVAGRGEADAFPAVVADIVACNCVVAGKLDEDTLIAVVAGSIACNSDVVAGIVEADAAPVVAYFVV